MPILIDSSSRVLCQGITGKSGTFHTQQCLAYGTQCVAGVRPGKGGQEHLGLPVFNSVQEAKRYSSCNVSMIFVPAPSAADAIIEACEAQIALIICMTQGMPLHDMIEVQRIIDRSTTSRLIGPNSPGVITPGQCKAGVMPGYIFTPGKVGIVSRSATLAYEAAWQTTHQGLGQSTCVGIGEDSCIGMSYIDVLEMFEQDPETEAILMIGEVGGNQEEEAAEWIKKYATKPIAAFIAGKTVPSATMNRIMPSSRAAGKKVEALSRAGVYVTENPACMGYIIQTAIERKKARRAYALSPEKKFGV